MANNPNFEQNFGWSSADISGQDSLVRSIVSAAMHSHPTKKREQIAAEMSELLGGRISVHRLNDFTSRVKDANRFPAAWVAAFTVVTGDERLLLALLSPRLRRLIEFAEATLANSKLQKKVKEMQESLLTGKELE